MTPEELNEAITVHERRVFAALGAQESAECLYELIVDTARFAGDTGFPHWETRLRRTASSFVPMFGMRAERDRQQVPWWRRPRWRAPDYRAHAERYRRRFPLPWEVR